jgi:hypothetical protein
MLVEYSIEVAERSCFDVDPGTEVVNSSTEVGVTRTPGARFDTPTRTASLSPLTGVLPPCCGGCEAGDDAVAVAAGKTLRVDVVVAANW